MKQVVRTTRGELLTIRGPLEAAHLLSVALERRDVVLCDTDVVVVDLSVTAARGEDVLIPCHSAN